MGPCVFALVVVFSCLALVGTQGVVGGNANAAEQELNESLRDEIAAVIRGLEQGKHTESRVVERWGPAGIPILAEYTGHESRKVRPSVYSYLWLLGLNEKRPEPRQYVVRLLALALGEQENNQEHIGKKLLDFKRGDFSDEAKNTIRA